MLSINLFCGFPYIDMWVVLMANGQSARAHTTWVIVVVVQPLLIFVGLWMLISLDFITTISPSKSFDVILSLVGQFHIFASMRKGSHLCFPYLFPFRMVI